MFSLENLALVLNIALACVAAFEALRRNSTPGASGLFVLALGAAIGSACYLLYDQPAYRAQQLLWAAVIFLSAAVAASAMFILALAQPGKREWISLRALALLAVMPLLTQILFWTKSWRSLFFEINGTPPVGSILMAGPWGKINGAYCFGLAACSLIFFLEAILRKHGSVLNRLGFSLLGAAFPVIVLALDLAGWSPSSKLELLPFAFTLAALGHLGGLMSQRETDSQPMDRDALVEGMDEGWMLLDAHHRIVDMNSAAERMTGLGRHEINAQHISAVLGDVPNLAQALNGTGELEIKRSIPPEEGSRYLGIRFTPLTDRDHKPMGHLAVWRDTTDQRLSEDSRQRAREEMFALISAISNAANSAMSMDDFLLETIYDIMPPFRSQVIGIFLMDERDKEDEEPGLVLASYLGLPAASAENLSYVPASSPIFDWVIKNRMPFQVEEAAEDARVPAAIRKTSVAAFLIVPLMVRAGEESQLLGCMCLARKEMPAFSQDEIERLSSISDHIANLIDNDRRRRLDITMKERQKLMRDLHDSVSQKLYGVVTTTEAAQAALEAGSAVDPAQEFMRIGENARQAVREMRLFLYQMQQIDVEKEGLVSVLHHRLAAVEGRSDIKARLLAEEEGISLSRDKVLALYYIAQEALNNVLRHARAKSVLVTIKQARQNVIMEIHDDGRGFDVKDVDGAGLGLQNMRERTAQIKGKLKIISKPNDGTKIIVTVRKDPAARALKPG